MKIRTGFVSNSSSSSFVIIGKDYDEKSFRDLIRPHFSDEEWNKNAYKYSKEEDLYEIFTELVPEKLGIDVAYDIESQIVYAGIEPSLTEKTRLAVLEILKKIEPKIHKNDVVMHNEVIYS